MLYRMVLMHKAEMIVNKCIVVTRENCHVDVVFSSHVVFFSFKNYVGIEMQHSGLSLRIEKVVASNQPKFDQMMNTVVAIGRLYGYESLYYADFLNEKNIEMFKKYGFYEKEVQGDTYNHHLNMSITSVCSVNGL